MGTTYYIEGLPVTELEAYDAIRQFVADAADPEDSYAFYVGELAVEGMVHLGGNTASIVVERVSA